MWTFGRPHRRRALLPRQAAIQEVVAPAVPRAESQLPGDRPGGGVAEAPALCQPARAEPPFGPQGNFGFYDGTGAQFFCGVAPTGACTLTRNPGNFQQVSVDFPVGTLLNTTIR